MRERERERERERGRQTDRQTDSERQREREKERKRSWRPIRNNLGEGRLLKYIQKGITFYFDKVKRGFETKRL